MLKLWGFEEWLICIWVVCYFPTYILIIYHDRRVEHRIAYSVICIFAWPVMWTYWFFSWLLEDKQK